MQIDGKEIPVQVIRTQYGQLVEVYETTPGRWVDLASGIVWLPACENGHWTTAMGGMHATTPATDHAPAFVCEHCVRRGR